MPNTLLKNPVNINAASGSIALQVTGISAPPAAAAGAQPASTLQVDGTAGQATTGTGQTAGAGANISLTAGAGGAAPTGSTNGAGGSVTINPGASGAGAGTAGSYGNVLLATAGGRVGVGTTAPGASLDITGTVQSLIATRVAGGGSAAAISMRKANTGMTTVANGHEIGNYNFLGWDGSNYILAARLKTVVDGAVTPLAVPMAMAFFTGTGLTEAEAEKGDDDNPIGERMRITSAGNVGIGTPAPTSILHVNGGVQVGSPTGGDMGSGTINVSGDIYKNGTAFTNPDYVFERHFAGATASGYAGPVPLDALEDTIKAQGQLPGIGREPLGVFGRQDILLEKLEEAYLYIIELSRRVSRLEAELEKS